VLTPLTGPSGIAVLPNGQLAVASGGGQAVYSVDPLTGASTVLSQFGVRGSGPALGHVDLQLYSVSLYVPEPSSMVLALSAALALICLRIGKS